MVVSSWPNYFKTILIFKMYKQEGKNETKNLAEVISSLYTWTWSWSLLTIKYLKTLGNITIQGLSVISKTFRANMTAQGLPACNI